MRRQYPFHLIEPKWQEVWECQETFRAWNPREQVPADHPFARRHLGISPESLPKYYILDMFPYPSGAGLHVGHPEGYTATDILARYRRACGYNVLHPFSWDAFGLPAEQYAVKTGQHPRVTTERNIAEFRRQIKALGLSYDWSREVDTTDPAYFKWTQWIFLRMYHSWFNPEKNRAEPIQTLPYPPELTTEAARRAYRDSKRLAYVSEAPVWWCEALGTVLANEEVKDGRSEVGDFPVARRLMRQWVLRITAYADRLLRDLDRLEWSDSLKEMQRNWIGRSEGAEVLFAVVGSPHRITVFTTRPDTLFGATYMVLAPEHELVQDLTTPACRDAVEAYRNSAMAKSDLERTELAREKTGVFIGAYAVNPANQERVPIWIADYVLASYGTGAIMAVPAHDLRDLEFARKFDLPIRVVVQAPPGLESLGYVGDGVNVDSGLITGLATPEAKRRMTEWLEAEGQGRAAVNYRLRDWLFSRQRYWGEPFPVVWRDGHHEALPESALPVVPPPLDDFKPTPDGQPPLARARDWVELPNNTQRETNTMPQWAGSCWYYLRYLDPRNEDAPCGPDPERYWMGAPTTAQAGGAESGQPTPGVDLYVGGTEHAVLHLLYARFWHKVLFDLGYVSTAEPFFKLVNQGLILGEDGQKMSKSRGNVVNPDDILKEYGADAFRLYEMFMGPLEQVKPWSTRGVEGVYRFLGRAWRLFVDEAGERDFEQAVTAEPEAGRSLLDRVRLSDDIVRGQPNREQLKVLHACIRKVTEDLEHLRFNTAISALMTFVNEATTWAVKPRELLRTFLVLLHPFAPHLAEELFARVDPDAGVPLAYQPWPVFDPALLAEDTIQIPVQVNGKLRDRVRVAADVSQSDLEAVAMEAEKVRPFLAGKTVRRVIVVPKKLINIVTD